jgi:hypothetical protein
MAHTFLQCLDPTTNRFCFQTFDDNKDRKAQRLGRTLHGPLDQHWQTLVRLNDLGAGVFVAINAVRPGRPRKLEFVERIRAIWQDMDTPFTGEYPLHPSITTQTSLGKMHRIWCADGLSAQQHQAIMRRMTASYGNDKGVIDLTRVLRLPGFWHMKDAANPQPVRLIDATGVIYTAGEVLQAFDPVWEAPETAPAPFRPTGGSGDSQGERERARIEAALAIIPADDRADWLKVGQALKAELGDEGRALWDSWSQSSPKFDVPGQNKAWGSFKRSGAGCISIRSLFYVARQYGFRG